MIQATLRGNSARKKQLRRFEEEEYEDELSDAAELIQSAYRGHVSRKKYLSQRSVSTELSQLSVIIVVRL